MNEHPIEVVPIILQPLAGSDHLSIVKIHGYQVVVRTESWAGVAKGAYAPPDSLLPVDLPEFAFLGEKTSRRYRVGDDGEADDGGTHVRVTAVRLRGAISHGLLFPVHESVPLGTDVADVYRIHHYNRPDPTGTRAPPPKGYHPTYSVASYNRWGREHLQLGEEVIVTEKINGENCRVFCDGLDRVHVGSRTDWYDIATSQWGAALTHQVLDLVTTRAQGITFYGELHGNVAGMRYGCTSDALGFRVFDAYDGANDRWLGYDELALLCSRSGVQMAPAVYRGPFDPEKIEALAHGANTKLEGAEHIAEGVVIRTPDIRRVEGPAGRTVFKLLNNVYLERER